LNKNGDYGRAYHQHPYEDYTFYSPVNLPWPTPGADDLTLIDPNRWAPLVEFDGRGEYSTQVHLVPHIMFLSTYDPELKITSYKTPPPHKWKGSYYKSYDYVKQAREVLAISAGLTDRQKLIAEHFDNKLESIGIAPLFLCETRQPPCSLIETAMVDAANQLATIDSLAAVWYQKRLHDTIRPQSAIPFLFNDTLVSAWAGPGLGTKNIPAREWTSYLQTDYHSEHPSGSACLCTAVTEFLKLYFGSNNFGFSRTWLAGSSVIEPGVTPATETTITWNTLDEYRYDCGQSRLYAGVHFPKSVEVAEEFCTQFGEMAYNTFLSYLSGEAKPMKTVPKPPPGGIWIGNLAGPAGKKYY